MRYELTGRCRKARDLDRVFLELDKISVRFVPDTGTGQVKMVSSKGAVPVGKIIAKASDETRDGARGEIGREGDEEEVGLLGVLGDEGVILESQSGVEEGLRWRVEGEGRVRVVDEDFERFEHVLVVWEDCGG